jgi:hypothetical protein
MSSVSGEGSGAPEEKFLPLGNAHRSVRHRALPAANGLNYQISWDKVAFVVA